MTKREPELDKYLETTFKMMQKVDPLNPRVVDEERLRFLERGEFYRSSMTGRKPVHQAQAYAQPGTSWWDALIFPLRKKEYRWVLNFFVAIAIAFAALFGAGGAVVLAAQDSLPDEPLYPLKTYSEDALLSLAGYDELELHLVLQFTDRRMEEIATLLAGQKTVPAGTITRMVQQLNTALQIAANMEAQQMLQALMQIQERVELQSQAMTNLNAASHIKDAQLLQLEERLRQQSRLAAEGQVDPEKFKLQMQNRQRHNTDQSPVPGENTPQPEKTPLAPGNSYGPGSVFGSPTALPEQFGPGPAGANASKTSTPGANSYGPGPAYGQTQTPSMFGPWWTLTPTPVSGHNQNNDGHEGNSHGSGGSKK